MRSARFSARRKAGAAAGDRIKEVEDDSDGPVVVPVVRRQRRSHEACRRTVRAVQVGSQVSGRVAALFADFNSVVKMIEQFYGVKHIGIPFLAKAGMKVATTAARIKGGQAIGKTDRTASVATERTTWKSPMKVP